MPILLTHTVVVERRYHHFRCTDKETKTQRNEEDCFRLDGQTMLQMGNMAPVRALTHDITLWSYSESTVSPDITGNKLNLMRI